MTAEIEGLAERIAQIEDGRAIERVIYSYGHALDFDGPETYADLFTEDAKLEVQSALLLKALPELADLADAAQAAQAMLLAKGGIQTQDAIVFSGRLSIIAFATYAPSTVRSLHVSSQPLVTLLDRDHATARTYLRIYSHRTGAKPTVDFFGRYLDELTRTDVGWRISRRICQP